jgi:riboflavin-specific deaminase-like protein
MDAAAEQDSRRAEVKPLELGRLLPPGEPATAEQIVAGFELDTLADFGLDATADFGRNATAGTGPHATAGTGPPSRPYVMLNMVSTLDGHTTLDGRSRALSGRADRELFHALRLAVDAVMAGAGTVRVERYGRIIPDESRRRLRVERGQSEEPLACIVSNSLDLTTEIPLLAEPAARVAILTRSDASLPERAAEVHYVRAEHDGLLDLPKALAELRERFGVHTLLCEGGPHLNAQLLHAGLVDELFLSLAPTLAGGDPAAGGEALRIIAGTELAPPAKLKLMSVLESESHLFLRYRVESPPDVEGPLAGDARAR